MRTNFSSVIAVALVFGVLAPIRVHAETGLKLEFRGKDGKPPPPTQRALDLDAGGAEKLSKDDRAIADYTASLDFVKDVRDGEYAASVVLEARGVARQVEGDLSGAELASLSVREH
jgi:hypothetical protein